MARVPGLQVQYSAAILRSGGDQALDDHLDQKQEGRKQDGGGDAGHRSGPPGPGRQAGQDVALDDQVVERFLQLIHFREVICL